MIFVVKDFFITEILKYNNASISRGVSCSKLDPIDI